MNIVDECTTLKEMSGIRFSISKVKYVNYMDDLLPLLQPSIAEDCDAGADAISRGMQPHID